MVKFCALDSVLQLEHGAEVKIWRSAKIFAAIRSVKESKNRVIENRAKTNKQDDQIHPKRTLILTTKKELCFVLQR